MYVNTWPRRGSMRLVEELTAKYPTAMPYFFTQDPDYITEKERAAMEIRGPT